MELKPECKRTEPVVIPEDWKAGAILEILSEIMDYRGRTPRKLGLAWGGGDIPALSAGNVKDGYIDFSEECYFGSEELYKRWMVRGDVAKGDIIFTTEAPLGNVALIPDDRRYILSQRTILLRTNSQVVESRFLYHVIKSDVFQRILLDNASGSTAKGIQRRRFERLSVCVPPLKEQARIANALSDVDALISTLDQLIAKKRDVKQATMQQLLTGKQRLPGFGREWGKKALSQIGECIRGVSYRGDDDLAAYDMKWTKRLLRANNVQRSAVVFEDMQYVNAARVAPQQLLQFGDVLICMANGSKTLVGKAARFSLEESDDYTFGAFMGCFRTRQAAADSLFVSLLFQSHQYRIQIGNLLAGSSINNLTPRSIESLEFVFPDRSEQAAIASFLSDMDAEITALEQKRDKTRALKQGMMQELLTGRIRLV